MDQFGPIGDNFSCDQKESSHNLFSCSSSYWNNYKKQCLTFEFVSLVCFFLAETTEGGKGGVFYVCLHVQVTTIIIVKL